MSDTKPHRTGVGVIAFPAAVVSVAWCLAVTRWSFEWPTALAALAAALLPAVVAFVTTTELVAWRWARDRGVDFESALVPQVHRHLVRTRVARTFGVTVPMAVDMMLMSRYNASDGSFRWFMGRHTRNLSKSASCWLRAPGSVPPRNRWRTLQPK